MLPADVGDFVGRERELAEVTDVLTDTSRTVRVAVITGPGGVGKTTLAVRVGHQLRKHFGDGQLYANLRGGHATAAGPAEVLGRFLRWLGVDGRAVSDSLDDRVDLYRSLLDDRRVFILLDDARDAAQVRLLLPPSPNCAALVTSRPRLSEVDGAVTVALGGFSPAEATGLLRGLCGADRVDAHPEDTATIVGLCGHLPLAIRIAGVRLAARPHWPLAKLAVRLSDARGRLDELATGDLAVAASSRSATGYWNPTPAARCACSRCWKRTTSPPGSPRRCWTPACGTPRTWWRRWSTRTWSSPGGSIRPAGCATACTTSSASSPGPAARSAIRSPIDRSPSAGPWVRGST